MIDYEDLKPEDLEDTEVQMEIRENAFKSPLFCNRCNRKMGKVLLDFDLPGGDITLHFESYKCSRCKREYLSGEQAEKFDSMLALIDASKQKAKIKFERSANFDGKNWFIRFPTDLTKGWNKGKVSEIVPITNKDFFIHIKDKKG